MSTHSKCALTRLKTLVGKSCVMLIVAAISLSSYPSSVNADVTKDPYLKASRLPVTLEIVLAHLLALSNVPLGVGEKAKDVHLDEDTQLMIFNQMVTLLREGYTRGKRPYTGKPIANLSEYIAATRPLRPDTGTLVGDLQYFTDKISVANVETPYEIDPFSKELAPFADYRVKLQAQRFEDRSNHHLLQALNKSDSMVGVVAFSMLGWIAQALGSASDYMGFINNLGVVPDAISFFNDFRDLLPVDTLNLGVGMRNISPQAGTTTPVPPTNGAKPGSPKGKGLNPAAPSAQLEPEVVATGNGASRSLTDQISGVSDRFRKLADHIGTMEERLVHYLVMIGQQKAGTQLKMIKFFESQVGKIVGEFSTMGQRIMKTPTVQKELNKEGVGNFFKLLAVLLEHYPPAVQAKVKKEMIWAFMRADSGADDLDAFAIFTDEAGLVFKQFLQIIASYVPEALDQLEEILDRQRANGKKLNRELFMELLSKVDPNAYHLRLTDFEFDKGGAGKLNTVVRARSTEDGRLKAVKVQNPQAKELIQMDEGIFKHISPALAAVVGSDPAFRKFGLSPATLGKIIETACTHTDAERNVPATVRNQRELGKYLARQYAMEVDDELVVVSFEAPEVWDAVDGSIAMVSDWVDGAIDIKEFKEHYPGPLKAVGFSAFRLFHDGLIFDGVRENLSREDRKKKAKAAVTPIRCAANFDLHGGNLMCLPPQDSIVSNFPFLLEQGYLPNRKVKHVRVNLPDWGISDEVAIDIIENILLLAGGASGNEISTITQALWNLQTAEARAEQKLPSRWHFIKRSRERRRLREQRLAVPSLAEISSKQLTYSQLRQIVKEKAKALHRAHKYYTPSEWIMFILERSHFHPAVMLIDRGFKTVNSFAVKASQGTFTSADFDQYLKRGHSGEVVKLLHRRMGNWVMVKMGIELVQWNWRKFRKACGSMIAGGQAE